MTIKSESELGKALKNDQDSIEIEGDLANRVYRIKATGKVAWAIAIASIAIAVGIIITTGGAGTPVSGLIGAGAVSVLGLPAAVSAVSIAVAAGGVGSLSSLRKYKIVSRAGNRIVLSRR